MLEKLLGYIPAGAVWICTGLSLAIPMLVYYINQKLHEYGDPPWKKNEQDGAK